MTPILNPSLINALASSTPPLKAWAMPPIESAVLSIFLAPLHETYEYVITLVSDTALPKLTAPQKTVPLLIKSISLFMLWQKCLDQFHQSQCTVQFSKYVLNRINDQCDAVRYKTDASRVLNSFLAHVVSYLNNVVFD